MDCRPGCGACCEAPSISSALPGLPGGKPASIPCPFLTPAYRCSLFGSVLRPSVCSSLAPEPAMCGSSREEALSYLSRLELQTAPQDT
ncbi:MAG: YkgJ family cysteine cluster protein [Spirochaetes bacterium]|nr:YkgJ family cysteine cluster protein [Spirochaetota bacterium]MBU1081271.1 YkgJ family cysteine cluster protein [Spirochaetota bacterium]